VLAAIQPFDVRQPAGRDDHRIRRLGQNGLGGGIGVEPDIDAETLQLDTRINREF
jgi:hypothetical protein